MPSRPRLPPPPSLSCLPQSKLRLWPASVARSQQQLAHGLTLPPHRLREEVRHDDGRLVRQWMLLHTLAALLLLPSLALAQALPSPMAGMPSDGAQATPKAYGDGLVAGKLGANGDASGTMATTQGGTTPRSMSTRFSKHLDIEDFAIHADGVTDDTAVLQMALNQAASSGRYELNLGPHQYLINSADLVIPDRVTLRCVGSTMGEYKNSAVNPVNVDYSILPCYIRLNPAYTIRRGAQTVVDGVNVLNSTYAAPSSMRQAVSLISSFAGTAFTDAGSDAMLRNSTILGFDTCAVNNGQQRDRIEHVYGDCTNGFFQSQSHDISRYRDVHVWPFLSAHTFWSSNGNYLLNGAEATADGNVRVNFNAGGEPPITGDKVYLTGIQGLPYSFRGAWTITVTDPTHFTLNGVMWPGTAFLTMTTTAGSALASTSDPNAAAVAGPGMLASSAGVATGTTIVAVYRDIVVLSQPANGTQSGGQVQIGPNSVPGGQAVIDLTYRTGTAFHWDNSENSSCADCFEFGHEVGYHFGSGAAAITCTACVSDNAYTENATNKNLWFDAGSHSISVMGGWFDTKAYNVYVSEPNNLPSSRVVGAGLSPGSMYTSTIQVLQGNFQMIGSSLAPTGYTAEISRRGSIYIADAPGTALFVGNDFGQAKFVAQNHNAIARLIQSGNVTGGGP